MSHGGFVAGAQLFDARSFGVSPAEAQATNEEGNPSAPTPEQQLTRTAELEEEVSRLEEQAASFLVQLRRAEASLKQKEADAQRRSGELDEDDVQAWIEETSRRRSDGA